MRWCCIIFILICSTCEGQPGSASQYLGGIWIPVDLRPDRINTYCIFDSNVIVITSSLEKVGDSLVFNPASVFFLHKGTIKRISNYRYSMVTRIVDSTGEYRSQEETRGILKDLPSGQEQILELGGLRYRRGFLYTHKSMEAIESIIFKVIPNLRPVNE
jgi:hypothetical protein